jgi:hypothetical protein
LKPRFTGFFRFFSYASSAVIRLLISGSGVRVSDGPPLKAQISGRTPSYRALLVSLIALGVAWRLTRYLLRMPLWGDEASLAVNFLDRGYRQLLEPLAVAQVSPILFLWSELTIVKIAGTSELALRFLPVVAGIVAMLIFWPLATLAFKPLPEGKATAVLATGILAVSYYPVRHACEVKPYSCDLLAAVCLLLLGLKWLADPEPRLPKILLIALLPLALGISFPAVLVASGIFIALIPGAFRHGNRRPVVGLIAYAAVLGSSFVVLYHLSDAIQFQASGQQLTNYWRDSFPPSGLWSFIAWFLNIHTGNLMAYPIGGKHAGSILTTLFFTIGMGYLLKMRRYSLLTILLAPFVMTFIAACLHRYPYGDSARIAQHLAPAICLLTGLGIVVVLKLTHPLTSSYQMGVDAVCVLLGAIAIGGIARDLWHPYKNIGDVRVREIVNGIFSDRDSIVTVVNARETVPSNFQWYLGRHGFLVSWSGRFDIDRLRRENVRLWVLAFEPQPDEKRSIAGSLDKTGLEFHLVRDESATMLIGPAELPPAHLEMFQWMPQVGTVHRAP